MSWLEQSVSLSRLSNLLSILASHLEIVWMQILEEAAMESVCEAGSSGLFILSSLLSGSIAVQT